LKAVKRFGQLDLSLDNYSTLPLELALVDSTLPDEEKSEPAPRAQAEPAARKINPAAPPPPAPKANPVAAAPRPAAPPVEKKATEPAPPVSRPPAARTDPPPKAPAHVESALAAGSPIEQLQAQWTKIINEAPNGMNKTPAAALLRSGSRPLEIQGDTIILSFKFRSHKENMEKIENQKTADKIVSSFMGCACKVRCVYEHENNHLVKAALDMGAQVIDTEGK
jgi:DNA polymerase-3 subunit gamma/tau